MSVYQVSTVNEGVRLAEKLKQEGKYDWFRGQVQDFPLCSSYIRRTPAEKEEVENRVARFERWVDHTPSLEALTQDRDAMIAVAQHYGIPSNFIDFTTEPSIAGFFASDRAPANSGRKSCIFCLNTHDMAEFWEKVPSKYPPPEFLRLDVPNLWRLEAQSGVFMFCPYGNLETLYDLDKILFPYTGMVLSPKFHQIYPNRKSQLETLLDQYFMVEKMREGDRVIEEQISRGLMTVHYVQSKDRMDPELVVPGGPPYLASWNPDAIKAWSNRPREVYQHTGNPEINMRITPQDAESESSRESLKAAFEARMKDLASKRDSPVSWNVQMDNSTWPREFGLRLGGALNKLWDGLRVLPHSMEDIAEGLANCVLLALAAKASRVGGNPEPWTYAAKSVFGDPIEVEFGSDDSSYSRAYVSETQLLSAVRGDISDYLSPKWCEKIKGRVASLLQAVYAPNRLFDFDKLAKLFARQITPYQVLTRGDLAIFYSPARIDAFGRP